MPLVGEAKKAWQAKYDADRRAAKAKELEENPIEAEGDVLDRAAAMDLELKEEGGVQRRYKSEVRSCVELADIFLGNRKKKPEAEDSEKKSTGKKKRLHKPHTEKILGQKRTFLEWLGLRDKARKDLYWLCYELMHLTALVPRVHQPVCDMFVKKEFDGVYFDGYTLQDVKKAIGKQNREKRMLLLFPRGFYKTVINSADCVQWMLNAPDIMISILSGTEELADDFMGAVKQCFNLQEDMDPSDFHLLFPEYILTGVKGTSNEDLWCPAALKLQKDASLWVRSIRSGISGKHCDIRKFDDAVTNSNSDNEDARKKLKTKIDSSRFIVGGYGFTDFVGTRYFTGKVPDYYGSLLLSVSDMNPLKYYCRGAWTVKPEFAKVPLKKLKEPMVDLLFPEKVGEGFKELMTELLDDEDLFRNQKLNDPIDADIEDPFQIDFTRDGEHGLVKHQKDRSWAPKPTEPGDIFITGDWAYSDNKYSDWSVLVAGRTYQRPDGSWGLWILEIIYGKWKYSELAFQIVLFAKKWNPKLVMLEEIVGADLLKQEIAKRCIMHGYSFTPKMQKPDQSKNAKRKRIKSVEILLTSDLLWFVSGPWLEETFDQFEAYKGQKSTKTRKDDIPDAVAMMQLFLPSSIPNTEMEAEMNALREKAMREHMRNVIFGGANGVPQSAPLPSIPTEPTNTRNTPFGIPGLKIKGDAK